MSRSIEEFVEAYDTWADEYDDDYRDVAMYQSSVSSVIEHAAPDADDTVLDLGTGTGAIALELADDADVVIGRDVSEEMLDRANEKAIERGIENATFGRGRFRDPNVETADVVVSNWAIHHLPPEEQCDAIETVAALEPRQFVFGAAMFFGDRNPTDPVFDPDSVYPATVGTLVDALTDSGFVVTDVEQLHGACGVLVARRGDSG